MYLSIPFIGLFLFFQTSHTPVLMELHWLLIQQRVLLIILVVTYKALHSLALMSIIDLIKPCIPFKTFFSSTQQLLLVPKHKTQSCGVRAFSAFAPTEYNKLSHHVTTAPTLSCFKSQLKTYLFTSVLV